MTEQSHFPNVFHTMRYTSGRTESQLSVYAYSSSRSSRQPQQQQKQHSLILKGFSWASAQTMRNKGFTGSIARRGGRCVATNYLSAITHLSAYQQSDWDPLRLDWHSPFQADWHCQQDVLAVLCLKEAGCTVWIKSKV